MKITERVRTTHRVWSDVGEGGGGSLSPVRGQSIRAPTVVSASREVTTQIGGATFLLCPSAAIGRSIDRPDWQSSPQKSSSFLCPSSAIDRSNRNGRAHLENRNVAIESHPVADRSRPENADNSKNEHHRDENVVRVCYVLLFGLWWWWGGHIDEKKRNGWVIAQDTTAAGWFAACVLLCCPALRGAVLDGLLVGDVT